MESYGTRTMVLAGIAMVSSALLGLLAAGPGNATTTAEVCPQGVACFYPQAGYQGSPQIVDFAAAPGCRSTIPARSVINNSDRPVGLYVDDECTQYLDYVEAGGQRASLIANVVTAEG